jgi:hypothetical protein
LSACQQIGELLDARDIEGARAYYRAVLPSFGGSLTAGDIYVIGELFASAERAADIRPATDGQFTVRVPGASTPRPEPD